jgi:hypothetical protein
VTRRNRACWQRLDDRAFREHASRSQPVINEFRSATTTQASKPVRRVEESDQLLTLCFLLASPVGLATRRPGEPRARRDRPRPSEPSVPARRGPVPDRGSRILPAR